MFTINKWFIVLAGAIVPLVRAVNKAEHHRRITKVKGKTQNSKVKISRCSAEGRHRYN